MKLSINKDLNILHYVNKTNDVSVFKISDIHHLELRKTGFRSIPVYYVLIHFSDSIYISLLDDNIKNYIEQEYFLKEFIEKNNQAQKQIFTKLFNARHNTDLNNYDEINDIISNSESF
jgi:hypothetical protein